MGRKRRINQSMCNKDYSCLKGFCPSFVTVRGGKLKKRGARGGPDTGALPEPALPQIERAWNLAIAGVGGTGVLTIGAILGMAAHIEGKVPMVLDMAGLAQKGGAVMSHVRISRADRPVAAPRIAAGGADLLLGADSVVSASKESIILCDPTRTNAVLNAKVTPVSDFVRLRDFDFQEAAVERLVEKNVRGREHFRNFSDLAVSLTGDEIGANLMMLGYAWQCGFVPIGRDAIAQAIELNEVSVAANLAAFDWGRLLAHDPHGTQAAAGPARSTARPLDDMTVDEIIAHRADHLRKYQDEKLARRYTDRLARLGKVAGPELLREAAISYARVLAYKDEYEVARLYSDPSFRAGLGAAFQGNFRIAFNLSPPILPGKDATGRPRKREFGAWILPVLGVLSRLKWLRGTWADPFSHSRDRRLERKLILLYEADLDLAEQCASGETLPRIRELLSLPQEIRGYGPIKEAAFDRKIARRKEIRAALKSSHAARSVAA
jgi:indolepyruvate ferredoxin oxidoreductase